MKLHVHDLQNGITTSFSTEHEFVLVVELADQDKQNIADMAPEASLYCMYETAQTTPDFVQSLLDGIKREPKDD